MRMPGWMARAAARFAAAFADAEPSDLAVDSEADPVEPAGGEPRVKDAKTGYRSYLAGMDIQPYNPDSLVKFKGNGLRTYQEMFKEVWIKVPWMLKCGQALADGWTLTPASDDPLRQEQCEFVKWNIENIFGGFQQDLWEMCGALKVGFGLSEKVAWHIDCGPFAGKIGYSWLRDLDPNAFTFVVDEYRRILGVTNANHPDLVAPEYQIEQFIHTVWMSEHENPHGTSDWRAAHRASWLYDVVSKLRARFVEKFAVPWVIGSVDGTLETEDEALFWRAIKSLQEDACAMLFKGQTIDIKQAVTDQSAFETMLARLQMEMIVNSLGSHLAVTEGALQGAKAQGEVHSATSDIMVSIVRQVLEKTVREQFIKPLLWMNYEDIDELPVFSLTGEKARTKEDAEREEIEIRNDDALMQMGATMSVPQIRKKYKREEPPEDEELATPKTPPPSPFGSSPFGGGLPGAGGKPLPFPPKDGEEEEHEEMDPMEPMDEAAMMTTAEAMAFAEEVGAGLPREARKQIALRLLNEDRVYRIGARAWNRRVARYRAELLDTLEKKRTTAA